MEFESRAFGQYPNETSRINSQDTSLALHPQANGTGGASQLETGLHPSMSITSSIFEPSDPPTKDGNRIVLSASNNPVVEICKVISPTFRAAIEFTRAAENFAAAIDRAANGADDKR